MTGAAPPIAFCFDFISPYSYIASQLLARAPYDALAVDCRPVVFGTMLSKLGVRGPGEIPERRRIGLVDVLLLAARYDIRLEGPPTHPFNSIYALRSVVAIPDLAARRRLMDRYFRAAWAESENLADPVVLARLAREVDIEQDPEDVASDREVRKALKTHTQDLLARGAWGVPTFIVGDVVLFGHERLEIAKALVDGRLEPDTAKLETLLARPQPGRVT